jgi:hypothetical protein
MVVVRFFAGAQLKCGSSWWGYAYDMRHHVIYGRILTLGHADSATTGMQDPPPLRPRTQHTLQHTL